MEFVDFVIVKEGWNKYKLSDGTTVRVRPILMTIEMAKTPGDDGRYKISAGINTLTVAISPNSMRGEPNPHPPTPEEAKAMPQTPIEFTPIIQEWNQYDIGKGQYLWIQMNLVNVKRVDGTFDKLGVPYYLVEHVGTMNTFKQPP